METALVVGAAVLLVALAFRARPAEAAELPSDAEPSSSETLDGVSADAERATIPTGVDAFVAGVLAVVVPELIEEISEVGFESFQDVFTPPEDLSPEKIAEWFSGDTGGELYSKEEHEQALAEVEEYEQELWGIGGYDPSAGPVESLSMSPSVEYWASLWWVQEFEAAWGRWPVDRDEYLDWLFQRIMP